MNRWIQRILISRSEARKVKREVYNMYKKTEYQKDKIWEYLMRCTIEMNRAVWYLERLK